MERSGRLTRMLIGAIAVAALAGCGSSGNKGAPSTSTTASQAKPASYCDAVHAYLVAFATGEGSYPTEADVRHRSSAFDALNDVAPAGIKADTTWYAAQLQQQVAAVKGDGSDGQKILRALLAIPISSADRARRSAARGNIEQVTQAACHTDFDITMSQKDVKDELDNS